jgi:hypothetical protein
MILQGDTSVAAPEKQLYEIYHTVLKNSVGYDYEDQGKEDMYKILREVLGSIIVLLSPLSSDSLTTLLHVPKEDVDQTLEDLHAILDIPKEQSSPIHPHHPSFRDFLLDKDRCGESGDQDYGVDEKQAHKALADNCMQLMSATLKRDICGLHAPCALATDIESSRLEQCFLHRSSMHASIGSSIFDRVVLSCPTTKFINSCASTYFTGLRPLA